LTTTCTYQFWGESTLEPDWWLSIENLKIYEEGRTDEILREGNLCEHRSTLKVNATGTYCRQLKMMMLVDGHSFHIKEANSSDECGIYLNNEIQMDLLRICPDVTPRITLVKQEVELLFLVAVALYAFLLVIAIILVIVRFKKRSIIKMNKKVSESLHHKSLECEPLEVSQSLAVNEKVLDLAQEKFKEHRSFNVRTRRSLSIDIRYP
jgi:cell division protein FtsL